MPPGTTRGRSEGDGGGQGKHRLIQDLRRNGLNSCAGIPERQVLPRATDHAADMAHASSRTSARNGEEVESFTTDFAHAFMTVPSVATEGRFNCCIVEEPLTRGRAPLDDTEPLHGSFVLWLVLGFGECAYPLLYARVA